MKEDKRTATGSEISFASRFVIFWCIGVVIGFAITAACLF